MTLFLQTRFSRKGVKCQNWVSLFVSSQRSKYFLFHERSLCCDFPLSSLAQLCSLRRLCIMLLFRLLMLCCQEHCFPIASTATGLLAFAEEEHPLSVPWLTHSNTTTESIRKPALLLERGGQGKPDIWTCCCWFHVKSQTCTHLLILISCGVSKNESMPARLLYYIQQDR